MTRNPEDRRSALNYWLYPRVTAAFTESAPVLHCADQSLVEAVHAVLGPRCKRGTACDGQHSNCRCDGRNDTYSGHDDPPKIQRTVLSPAVLRGRKRMDELARGFLDLDQSRDASLCLVLSNSAPCWPVTVERNTDPDRAVSRFDPLFAFSVNRT
jgi:hypothetical protein